MPAIARAPTAAMYRIRDRQREPQLASLGCRLLAWLINAMVATVAIASAMALVLLVAAIASKLRDAGQASSRSRFAWPSMPLWLRSRPAGILLQVAMLGAFPRTKERRSLGVRILRLRRVDARTGAEPNRRQLAIRLAARNAWRVLANRLFTPPKRPGRPDHERLRSEIEAARRTHAGDQEALQSETHRRNTRADLDVHA